MAFGRDKRWTWQSAYRHYLVHRPRQRCRWICVRWSFKQHLCFPVCLTKNSLSHKRKQYCRNGIATKSKKSRVSFAWEWETPFVIKHTLSAKGYVIALATRSILSLLLSLNCSTKSILYTFFSKCPSFNLAIYTCRFLTHTLTKRSW